MLLYCNAAIAELGREMRDPDCFILCQRLLKEAFVKSSRPSTHARHWAVRLDLVNRVAYDLHQRQEYVVQISGM